VVSQEEKQVRTNTGRGRLNINGALDPETLEVTVRYSKTINAEETIIFLDQLQQRYIGKKIKLIAKPEFYRTTLEVYEEIYYWSEVSGEVQGIRI